MKRKSPASIFLILVFLTAGCNLPVAAPTPTAIPSATWTAVPASPTLAPTLSPTETPLPPTPTLELPTPTKFIPHSFVPSTDVRVGDIINDVTCLGTATEQRAPYGDSYNIGLFERPFMQDMGYVSDLDIASYNQSRDDRFYYVSIQLVGTNPNNPVGINYAVEIDLDADGYGDTVIMAHPPYSAEWTTANVIVAQDTNHDSGGLSAEKSDAPLPGDGYDQVIFDGSVGLGDDPDLAWVRVNAGKYATVQFAFKRGLAEEKFMLGVFADAGIRDVFELDYNDRFTEEQAGSPIRGSKFYPLKLLFGVDNVCREAYGFSGNGEEPHRCPKK
jgi:hypothetical protein